MQVVMPPKANAKTRGNGRKLNPGEARQLGWLGDTIAVLGNSRTPAVGPSLIGLGFGPYPAQTFCGCTIGHSWQAALFGTTVNFPIPNDAGLIGVQVGVQGADFGGTGGCATPNFTLTRTHQIVIG